MSDVSPLLALPLILADQAQKHVTHNEAIDRLDVLVQLVVEQIDAITPPPAAVEGQVWALGEGPVGAWAGQALRLASWRGGAWVFIAPAIGWRAWVRGAGVLRVFTGSGWVGLLGANDLQNLAGIGINTTSDATNKLAVASAATLLSHAGAGHQVKVNKATPGDTASLLFQSGWSGRAEMGLAGADDFSVKVSADGAAWNTALTMAGGSGAVAVPAGLLLAAGTAATPGLRFATDEDTGLYRPAANQIGLVAGGVRRALLSGTALQVDVPLTGTAVTQSAADTTAGRLLKVGDFGVGSALCPGITDFTGELAAGFYSYSEDTAVGAPASQVYPGAALVTRSASGATSVTAWRVSSGTVPKTWRGHRATATGALTWVELPSRRESKSAAHNNAVQRNLMTGAQWTTRTSAADNQWYGVAWSPELGLFCAVAFTGTGNRVMTSPDGITWTARTSAADNQWYGVAWSPELGLFCAVAFTGTGNRVMTSPDGITWTARASAADNQWTGIAWSPELGLFCAVAMTGTGNRVMTSPDGITWTARTSAADNQWRAVTWSPELGLFCAVAMIGTGNLVMTSPDGIIWTARTPAVSNQWIDITWSPELGLFCAVAFTGTGNRVMTSPDGITWTARASAADNQWYGIAWSSELGLFCAVAMTGTGNQVMTSPDGVTWTARASAAANQWHGIAWSPELGLFCAVAGSGTGNRAMTSAAIRDYPARGSNANGSYTRFADGTQICTLAALNFANASTADGAIFRSAEASWTFPSPFSAAPVVSGGVDDIDGWISVGLPTTTTCAVRAKSSVSKAGALNGRLVAQGLWV